MITRPLQLLTSIKSTRATVGNLNMSDLISKDRCIRQALRQRDGIGKYLDLERWNRVGGDICTRTLCLVSIIVSGQIIGRESLHQ
jgi:hypothetical protein